MCVCVRRHDQMNRAPASCSGRSENPNIVGLSLEPATLRPGRVKSMTFRLILVAS